MTEFYDINFQPVLQQDDTLGKQKTLNKGETPLFSYKVDLNNSFFPNISFGQTKIIKSLIKRIY